MNLLVFILVLVVVVPAAVFVAVKLYSRRIESNVLAKIEDSFGKASLDALSKNSETFFTLAKERLAQETQSNVKELASKKELIDNTFQQMKEEMEKVQNLINSFEKDRDQKFGALSKGLQSHSEQTAKLQEVTNNLSKVLSDSRQRGLWGQRIADDILRAVGMKEGLNYTQQKAMSNAPGRPDFTFILPNGKVMNMDVKFPLDNFKHFLEETSETARQSHRSQFLKDARGMVKQVAGRDYINTDANTLDFAIVFIPLEQAYAFIMENDKDFIDDALKMKVVVCSPWTLYAALAIIRQSVDNFNLEKSANRILELLNSFYKQWGNYVESMDRLGKKIDDLQKEYSQMVTTRRNQLEKPLQQIEQLTRQRLAEEDATPAPAVDEELEESLRTNKSNSR